jgi:drug/metabolite transporter superfamily protein YnfA
MQMNYPSTGQILIMLWFSVSAVIAIVGNFVLWFWLRRQSVKLLFMMVGAPGYLDYAYIKWCRSKGQQPNAGLLVFRGISLINVIVAGIFFVLLAATRQ